MRSRGRRPLQEHGVYRCSISVWGLNVWSSATPDIPLSQERVLQLGSFLYGENGEAPGPHDGPSRWKSWLRLWT